MRALEGADRINSRVGELVERPGDIVNSPQLVRSQNPSFREKRRHVGAPAVSACKRQRQGVTLVRLFDALPVKASELHSKLFWATHFYRSADVAYSSETKCDEVKSRRHTH